MRIIDFHNHYYPPEFIDALRSLGGEITVTEDSEGNPVIHSPGDYNIVVKGHRDVEFREGVLDDEGIDMQVLTFTAPGTQEYPAELAVQFARMVNDALADIVRERSDRFTALATLPMNDPAASLSEMNRAMDELGYKGFMVFGNVNGIPLSDERFWPIYEMADERKAVLYIHPTYPVGVEAMKDYWLMPLVGFTFDTTLAAAGLVFSGVAERFPGINWVLAHLGGAIPYLAERFDRGFRAFEDCRANIDRPPSEYLKKFFYDTVNFDSNALQLAIDFAGPDHLLAGSDYPHQIGSIRSMLDSIQKLQITDKAKTDILGENAARVLGLGT